MTLAPFFLSKYELTQGQWERFTGQLPSYWYPGIGVKDAEHPVITRAHPVETVSNDACRRWLPRFGLRMPTEVEWERAARGGTDTPWWAGREVADLAGAGNLCDSFAMANGLPRGWPYEAELDDGFTAYAPVGLFAPNPFGLHDVIGNVREHCADVFSTFAYDRTPEPGHGLFGGLEGRSTTNRGGSFTSPAHSCRTAYRAGTGRDGFAYDLGVRPARGIDGP